MTRMDLHENRRILIVDDNPSIHDDYRKVLAAVDGASDSALDQARLALFGQTETREQATEDYQIDSAFQGREAVSMVKRAAEQGAPYALAFVDMRMPPGLDGVQTITQLWHHDPNLEVVICSAYSDYSWDQITAKLGHTDQLLILKKPFDSAEVAQLACALTAKWNLARQAELRHNDLERMVEVRTSELQTTNDRLTAEIQRRKQAEDQLAHDEMHDVLTDLPNRSLLLDRLRRCVERTKRMDDYIVAVLLMDLDEFKVINDSLGHALGDKLLLAAAERLSSSLRTLDTVARAAGDDTMARLGGDEFVILLDGVHSVSEAVMVAERIKKQMSQPFHLDGHEVVTTVSIGIATSEAGQADPEEMLRDADTALYRAKAHGKARHVVFDHDMRIAAVKRLRVEGDLRKAIERHELRLEYQPIVCLQTGRIHSFEALVRWHHPERGPISPVEFIPLAEQTGLILPLGQWVLQEACGQLHRWHEQFKHQRGLTVSVNLSTRQFRDAKLIEQIDDVLAETGLNPRLLKLEITESVLVEDNELAERVMAQLKARRIDLHLDDFGTGYSSLSYLHNLPVDALKVDRSFVMNMGMGRQNAATVQAVVTLAHNQNLRVIAEGVETADQMAQLHAMDCDLAQGYYFARPMPAQQAAELLDGTVTWRASA